MKCILLVGGNGERLWPVSRDLYPKSLLKLNGSDSLFMNTYNLAKEITSEKNILTITNIKQLSDINLQLNKNNSSSIVLSEPMSKNTAPAVAAVLTYIKNTKDEIVIILPIDFAVEDKKIFKQTIEKAVEIAKSGYIVALGVKPLYSESGYGYIQAKEKTKNARKIVKFIEKPSDEEIEKYYNNKDYFWNCGIYISKASVLKSAFDKYAQEIISGMSIDMFDENNKIKYEYYEKLPSISIDYAIMEKTDKLVFIELETNWYDFGSWQSIYNNKEKDNKNNVIQGNVILDKVQDSFIYSSKELVAVSGMKNTVVIETEDAVLVCDKDKAKNINKLVKELKKQHNETTLIHKTVFRPWGFYTCLNEGPGWLTKIITVSPGHKLSLQSHNHRSEHWVVLEGNATVILDEKKYTLQKRQSINIPLQAKHSLQNHSKEPLKILEVQKGSYISEDDIVRYEDMYGRIK